MIRINRAILAGALALELTVSVGLAQPVPQAPPRLTVIGIGAGATCEDWDVAGGRDEGIQQWAFGYLSAIAAGAQLGTGTDPLATWNANAIHSWLQDYCRAKPADSLSVALIRVVFSGLK